MNIKSYITKKDLKKEIDPPYKQYARDFIIEDKYSMKEFKRKTILKMQPVDNLNLITKFYRNDKSTDYYLEVVKGIQNQLRNNKMNHQLLAKVLEFLYYPNISVPSLKRLELSSPTLTYLQFEVTSGSSFIKRDLKYNNYYLIENLEQICIIRKHILNVNHTYILKKDLEVKIESSNEQILSVKELEEALEIYIRELTK